MPWKRMVLYLVGAVLIVMGITFTIKDWLFIKMVFRGVVGPLMAVVGLVVLTAARD
ncbi:MAG: hypothetical protein HGA80_05490 [Candidatus Omnitrophica bacterium]|nr:hypothetical protein [Candidatus Omnitrophota bacterium]